MQKNRQNLIYGVLFLVVFLGLVLLYYVQKSSLKNEVARICNTQTDVYGCVRLESIKHKSIKPCYSLNAGINDKCIEEVYQSLGDKSLCADIFESGIRNNCEEYFQAR